MRRGWQMMRWLVGWHHWLHEHEFEQDPGVGDGQGSLACCSSQGHKESDTTEWLNWDYIYYILFLELQCFEDLIMHNSTGELWCSFIIRLGWFIFSNIELYIIHNRHIFKDQCFWILLLTTTLLADKVFILFLKCIFSPLSVTGKLLKFCKSWKEFYYSIKNFYQKIYFYI